VVNRSGFNVKDQVEQGHLMASLLTQEEERTFHLAAALAAELMTKAAKDEGHRTPPAGASQVVNNQEYVEFEIYYA
jgi:hypothetical protein